MIYRIIYSKPPWIFLLFFLFVLETGCEKNNILNEYSLGNLIYSNPYQGTEVLVFNSSMGDVYSFHGNGRYRNTFEHYESVNSNDIYTTEEDYCSFIDDANNYSIFISMKTYKSYPPTFSFSFYNFIREKTSDYGAISHFILPLSIENLEGEQEYYDSIAIGGKHYYQVFSDSCEIYFPNNDKIDTSFYLSKLYYNITDGLIKLSFSNGTDWELKEVIP